MDSLLMGIVWAVFGAISFKVASSLFSFGHYSLFAKKVLTHSLMLVGTVVEDLAFTRELKYLQMAKSGMSPEEIDFIKKVDEQALKNWKESSINLFKGSFPGPLESIVKFNNWKEAMQELDRITKNRG